MINWLLIFHFKLSLLKSALIINKKVSKNQSFTNIKTNSVYHLVKFIVIEEEVNSTRKLIESYQLIKITSSISIEMNSNGQYMNNGGYLNFFSYKEIEIAVDENNNILNGSKLFFTEPPFLIQHPVKKSNELNYLFLSFLSKLYIEYYRYNKNDFSPHVTRKKIKNISHLKSFGETTNNTYQFEKLQIPTHDENKTSEDVFISNETIRDYPIFRNSKFGLFQTHFLTELKRKSTRNGSCKSKYLKFDPFKKQSILFINFWHFRFENPLNNIHGKWERKIWLYISKEHGVCDYNTSKFNKEFWIEGICRKHRNFVKGKKLFTAIKEQNNIKSLYEHLFSLNRWYSFCREEGGEWQPSSKFFVFLSFLFLNQSLLFFLTKGFFRKKKVGLVEIIKHLNKFNS